MKERVADLIGPRAKAMWVMTFHSACVRILRREATRLGLRSTFSIYDAADSQRLMTMVLRDLDLDPKRYQPAGVLARGEQPQERPRRRGVVCRPGRLRRLAGRRGQHPPGADGVAGLHRLPAPAPAGQRHGLRRPHHDDRPSPAGVPGRRRALPPPVPPHPRRRVPGHQRRAVPAGQGARRAAARRRRPGPRRAAGRAVRRRRRRPVDLRLPRRDDPQHRRVRGGLPPGAHHPPGAELPVDPDDPAGGQRGHRPQREAPGQEPVDRQRRRRADRRLRRRQRARRGGVRRQADRPPRRHRGRPPQGRRDLLPHQRAVPGLRGGARPGRDALQGRRRHPVLRAQGDQGRAGLPAGRLQPGRHGQPAPHHQRAQARHRRAGRGVRRAARRPRADPLRRRARPGRRRARASPPAR